MSLWSGHGTNPCFNAQFSPEQQSAFGAGACIDLGALCIVAGKSCWVLCVDALVLSADGGVLDALSIATKVTRPPRRAQTAEPLLPAKKVTCLPACLPSSRVALRPPDPANTASPARVRASSQPSFVCTLSCPSRQTPRRRRWRTRASRWWR